MVAVKNNSENLNIRKILFSKFKEKSSIGKKKFTILYNCVASARTCSFWYLHPQKFVPFQGTLFLLIFLHKYRFVRET